EEEFRVTRDGTTVGTVDYLSPEQARDSGAADIRSDIYSLGCTLFHMLAGMPPFAEGSLTERLLHHAESEPPDLLECNPQIPEDLRLICRRMLAKKPERRYQTPAELLRALTPSLPPTAPSGEITPAPLTDASDEPTKVIRKPPTEKASAAVESRPSAAVEPRPVPEPAPALAEDLSPATDEQRRIAAGQYQRAVQVVAAGDFEYGLPLLLKCCELEPTNVTYRKALREARRKQPRRCAWRGGACV